MLMYLIKEYSTGVRRYRGALADNQVLFQVKYLLPEFTEGCGVATRAAFHASSNPFPKSPIFTSTEVCFEHAIDNPQVCPFSLSEYYTSLLELRPIFCVCVACVWMSIFNSVRDLFL